MKPYVRWLWGALLVALPAASSAELLCRAGPVTVEGRVVRVEFRAKEHVKAIPGMSGTLGQDRVRPAHYEVVLDEYSGVTGSVAAQMAYDMKGDRRVPGIPWDDLQQGEKPPQIVVLLNKKWRMKALKRLAPGARIKVVEYRVTGDEGGCWASYDKAEILPAATP